MAGSRPTAPAGTPPGWGRRGWSAGSWRLAAPSSGPPTTSTGRGRRRRTPPASRPPTTGFSRWGTGAEPPLWSCAQANAGSNLLNSSPGFHLKDREQGSQPYRGDDIGHDDRDHADRGRLADAEALEGNEIEQERNVGRVLARPAKGQHVDRVKGLHDKQRSEQRAQLQERPDQWEGDVAEGLEWISAVDARSLEDLRVLRLKSSQDDQHHEGRPAPNLDGYHRHHRELVHPIHPAEAKWLQQIRQKPEQRVEKGVLPDQGAGCGHDEERRDHKRSNQSLAENL